MGSKGTERAKPLCSAFQDFFVFYALPGVCYNGRMKNYTPTYIKQVMSERGLAPLKQFGQNFLIDDNILQKIADTVPRGSCVI